MEGKEGGGERRDVSYLDDLCMRKGMQTLLPRVGVGVRVV